MTLSQHPAIGGTVGGMFHDIVLGVPNAIAVRDGVTEFTYRDFNKRVNRLASALEKRGLAHGDRVAILAQNCIDYVTLLMACAKKGYIAACVNWRLVDAELDASIALVDPKILFVSPDYADKRFGALPIVEIGAELNALLETGSEEEPHIDVASEDGLLILYTSGTTGQSKGALVSHRAMLARGALMRADWRIFREDGFIAWAPLFHMASADPTLATLCQGGTVTTTKGFDAPAIAEALTIHSVGWMVLMPGMIERLADELESQGKPLCRVAAAGCMANLIPGEQIARISGLLNAPFLNSFGSTETGIAPCSGNWIPAGERPKGLGKLQNSICEIRLMDEEGNPVPDGEVGEIWLRTPTLFSAYWNNDEATKAAFAGGWYHMGDAFYRDENGLLHFADRKKYLIKSGGENIYPAEIELVIRNMEKVKDAVVVCRPDSHWGEVPVAFAIIERDDVSEAEIRAALDGQIARYKMPKEIHLITEAEIERNPTGKIRRDLLEVRAESMKG